MPELEGCSFSMVEAAKSDMKRSLRATDAEGGGKAYNYM